MTGHLPTARGLLELLHLDVHISRLILPAHQILLNLKAPAAVQRCEICCLLLGHGLLSGTCDLGHI